KKALVTMIAFIKLSLFTTFVFSSYRFSFLAVFMSIYSAEYYYKNIFLKGRKALACVLVLFCIGNPALNTSEYVYDREIITLTYHRAESSFYDFLYKHVGENETILDFRGDYIYRMHAFPIWFFYDFEGRHENMDSIEYEKMPFELSRSQPKALIISPDRYSTVLSEENKIFLRENFRCTMESKKFRLFVPTKSFDSVQLKDKVEDFSMLASGTYTIEGECGKVWIDDVVYEERVFLDNSKHTLRIEKEYCNSINLTLEHPNVSLEDKCRNSIWDK
ncbi:MAG: hypothetical protein KKD39_04705, partial [Candidatus Altiarchaeota archaeon]|nr:hypothetical protein [Candidatus Altiarchaeota archaeon]